MVMCSSKICCLFAGIRYDDTGQGFSLLLRNIIVTMKVQEIMTITAPITFVSAITSPVLTADALVSAGFVSAGLFSFHCVSGFRI